ncbi:LuxR C-terminal-related transcriptional regulator [Draconibacterium sp.]|uniref:LuxR C-terminal-related transcriptional regulator n=1 Tax=Draconibacterium sp. TaxID=1965318 RepID=UPI0035616B37
MCRIAILEQFNLFGSGIKSILEEADQFNVVIQADSVNKLLAGKGMEKPDVIIFDIIHDDNSGIKVLKRINRTFTGVPVLLIVSNHYADCFEEYIRLGVKGFIFHNSSGKELIKAIKKLKNGEEYFAMKVWDIFRSTIRARKAKAKNIESNKLTEREMTVLKLFTKGLSYKEIGVDLNISPRTVETHKRNILAKLKIRSTADMIKYAYRNNILS